jgi:hypothetical protein
LCSFNGGLNCSSSSMQSHVKRVSSLHPPRCMFCQASPHIAP